MRFLTRKAWRSYTPCAGSPILGKLARRSLTHASVLRLLLKLAALHLRFCGIAAVPTLAASCAYVEKRMRAMTLFFANSEAKAMSALTAALFSDWPRLGAGRRLRYAPRARSAASLMHLSTFKHFLKRAIRFPQV